MDEFYADVPAHLRLKEPLRMAGRITGRPQVLLPRTMYPDKRSKIRDYIQPDMEIRLIGCDPATGQLDLGELRGALSAAAAAVFFENPSYLGFIEGQGAEVSRLAHAQGALSVAAVDPLSLAVLTPPADYGADIVCGDPSVDRLFCGYVRVVTGYGAEAVFKVRR
jgi:glycine dehydrogenase subunit 1